MLIYAQCKNAKRPSDWIDVLHGVKVVPRLFKVAELNGGRVSQGYAEHRTKIGKKGAKGKALVLRSFRL